jgi:hypothetical protein
LAPLQGIAHFDFLAGVGAFRPKNSGPDQRVPVISRAIIDSVGSDVLQIRIGHPCRRPRDAFGHDTRA